MNAHDHLPLNPRVLALLLALGEGPRHGYSLMLAVEETSGGSISLDPGSLYRHLSRLETDGILEEVAAPRDEASPDPRRRYYGLTRLGRSVVAAETRRLQALLPEGEALRHLEEG